MIASSMPGTCSLQVLHQRRVLDRRGVADRVRHIDRRRPGLDRRAEDLDQEVPVRARRVLGRELDVARERLGEARPSGRPAPAPRRGSSAACASRWMSEVAMKVWIRGDSAPLDRLRRPLDIALDSRGPARRPSTPFTRSAISSTASKSPGDAAGKPASMMSTPSSTSASATSSFSSDGHRRARRLLAVAQRRVEDDDPRRLVDRLLRHAPASFSLPSGPATATGRPFLSHGIISRSSAPTCSTSLPCALSRMLRNRSRPASFSADPLLGERAVLDLGQQAAHRLLDVVVDDLRPGVVVAVLGGVADRVAHVRQAALVDEVDDQLELVQALEVGDLRLVAGLDQRVEPGLDQRRDARRRARPARRRDRSRSLP